MSFPFVEQVEDAIRDAITTHVTAEWSIGGPSFVEGVDEAAGAATEAVMALLDGRLENG